MSLLDTLIDNFDLSSESEEGDDLNAALPELRNNRYRLSQLPSPPPPIAFYEEQGDVKRKTTIERSISGSFKKFNIITPNTKLKKNENQRLMVLQEIITSEQDYVKDVAFLVQVNKQKKQNIHVITKYNRDIYNQ